MSPSPSRLCLLTFSFAACLPTEKEGSKADVTVEDNLKTIRETQRSNSSGVVNLSIEVNADQTSFLVTGESDQFLSFESITDPSGDRVFYWEPWYNSDEGLTGALYPEAKDSVMNWPVREEDGPLSPGTWKVQIATSNSRGYYAPDTAVDLTVQIKEDPDTSVATVRVLVAYAEGLGSDETVVAGTEAAVARWAEVWAPYGLELEVTYADTDMDPTLPDMYGGGSTSIRDVSASEGQDYDVTVAIGEDVEGDMDVFGVSGGIPGTLVATKRSAVVVSWIANAGGDGTFEEEDIQLYGETLAHEVGHYMGLFHPVEMSWDYWDSLSDTSKCRNARTCEEELGTNNMFPYPVCDWRSCTAQDQLSDEQVGVEQLYVGAL